jgi:NAD/NADP transhydrogenase beta subunit
MKLYRHVDAKNTKARDVAITIRDSSVVIVDPDSGATVCSLYNMKYGMSHTKAFDALANNGYRTDFATWGAEGRMSSLLEEVE